MARGVVEPIMLGLNQRPDLMGQVQRIGGRKDLVVHHADGLSFPGQLQHQLHEIAAFPAAASHAEQTGGAHDEVPVQQVLDEVLAREFGDAVDVDRVGQVGLHVASSLAPVKDVVGTEVDKHAAFFAAGQRQFTHPKSVDGERALRVHLTLINLVIGGCVDHQLRLVPSQRRPQPDWFADVHFPVGEGD